MGFNNASARGLPRGIIFSGPTPDESYSTFAGGSNGQTTLLPFFDAILGITHTENPKSITAPIMAEMRKYMPAPHVRFLEYISTLPNFRDFILAEESGEEVEELRVAYNAAVSALRALRDRHVRLVGRFVVVPAGRARSAVAATAGSAKGDGDDDGSGLKGSGGAEVIGFLKGMRGETEGALL